MELTDICPLATWAELEDQIYERSGLNAAVYNTVGVRINGNQRWPNRLCPEIKATPKGQSFICATAHMNLANMAMRRRQPIIEECDAGMVKLVVPIFYKDTFLGSAGGCGRLPQDGAVETFLVNKITGLDENTVEHLAQGIPTLSMEKLQELASFIQARIDRIIADFTARR